MFQENRIMMERIRSLESAIAEKNNNELNNNNQ